MSLAASLAKLRPHTSSSLPHQKAPANLLVALESTLSEQGTERTPTAYFAALLTALESSKSKVSFGDGDLLPAILYLFAVVAPHVPHPVVRSHLSTLLSLLSPLLPELVPHAPPLRSELSIFGAIFQSLESSQLDSVTTHQSFNFILDLTIDSRPKVRRKAAEVVRDVLASPPPPLLKHPYSERVGEWANMVLSSVSSGSGSFSKHGGNHVEMGIHLIAMLKPTISQLPKLQLTALTSILLSLPRLGNTYLAQSAYTLLSMLITDTSDLAVIVSSLLASPPLKSDVAQTPAWLDLLNAAFSLNTPAFREDKEIETGFRTIFTYLEAPHLATRTSAARTLAAILTNSVPTSLVEEAVIEHRQKKPQSPLLKIISHIRISLDALPYATAIPQMIFVLGALFPVLRHRPGPSAPTASEILLLDLVQKVGEMRIRKSFEHKEVVDEMLKSAMGVIGPEVIFRVLPLGLIPEDREPGSEPHAYILPLLNMPHPAPLGHFVKYFVPLSERMFNLQQSAESNGRVHEAKMWQVLIAQVWAGLVGYCWGTRDLIDTFNPTFAQLLSQILYNQPSLRTEILKALKIIVESNVALSSDTRPTWENTDTISSAEARRNVEHLRLQAESWISVLLNVFGSAERDARGAIGEVIAAWVQLARDEEVAKIYKKIANLLEQNLTGSGSLEVALMAQELLVVILPTLPHEECTSLWTLCTSDAVLASSDSGIQKRGYRILTRLMQGEKLAGTLKGETVLQQLEQRADAVLAPAKRERTNLLTLLLPLIPSTSLHLIPSLIPEAVLTTKEPAERTRLAAFELIVAMGRKMQEGGVVARNRVDGMEEDGGAAAVQASVEEYLTMVAAGLAGATPHMISASITAISRLVFEFQDAIPSGMLDELLGTLLVFVSSANREIVKSALGFIKLSVHTFPPQLVEPHLKQLVPILLGWAGDHKNHFKIKVRHIFERMIRRFGWSTVYGCVGSDAGANERGKVLMNIKKRKDRAKRKKAQRAEESENGGYAQSAVKTGDAFEDVLYGSESEIEDSDEDEGDKPSASKAGRRGRKDKGGARLRIDADEPMDLLHGAADNLTNASRARRRKPGGDASQFKVDETTGRMIIENDEESDEMDAVDEAGGAAYREVLTSEDGFTRGPHGRVKFNKDTKKRRRANEEVDVAEDVEMVDAGGLKEVNKNKKKKGVRLGQEFKAKNAGGDVKRGGMDPYAYLPLSQASKKKGGKSDKIRLLGRR